MTAFTIITGMVTLLGFFLQVKDYFPQYRRYYSSITLILLGITIGLSARTVSQITIQLAHPLTLTNIVGLILCGGSGLIISVSFIASVMLTDKERRMEASKIGSSVSGFLVFLLLFFYSFFFTNSFEKDETLALTYDEKVECALNALGRKNYDRSLALLSDASASLSAIDHRKEGIMQLIQKVQQEQARIPSGAL